MIKARLSGNIPENRFRTFNGRTPKVGDLVSLDQGFTFQDGKAGCIVYFIGSGDIFEYEAEVYESELGENET